MVTAFFERGLQWFPEIGVISKKAETEKVPGTVGTFLDEDING